MCIDSAIKLYIHKICLCIFTFQINASGCLELIFFCIYPIFTYIAQLLRPVGIKSSNIGIK